MRLVGKKPVVLADLDALTDDEGLVSIYENDPAAEEAVQHRGHDSVSAWANNVRNELNRLVEKYWSDINREAEAHHYWQNKSPEEVAKAKRRAGAATLLTAGDEKIDEWPHSSEWSSLKRKIEALLDALAEAGCFVLRRGTIEDYYFHVDADDVLTGEQSPSKPKLAIDESERIKSRSKDHAKSQYEDVVRALEHASQAPEVDELSAVKELVLTIASPALVRLPKADAHSLQALAQEKLGDGASLFDLSKVGSGSEAQLKIDVNSDVLAVEGFPVLIDLHSNPNEVVESKLRPS